MFKSILTLLTLGSLVLAFSCTNNNQSGGDKVAVVISSTAFHQSAGKDCDRPDSLRFNCAEVDLHWPKVDKESEALKKAVAQWATSYLVGILAVGSDDSTATVTTVEAATAAFFQMHQEFTKDFPDSPMSNYVAESQDTILLNFGKLLTLEITGYVYAGGAHGSPTAAVATFETTTGKQLHWDDIVTDTVALKVLMEKKYRETRADIFKPTDGAEPFAFDETFPFALPLNYGLTKAGIYCHYLAYEVGPYAIGDTQFVLSFAELGAILKVE
ncbi:MAG: DUF3298 domain-containing protein [Saprospiraceae bacterium]